MKANSSPLVSIIIPVYNVEKYLIKCLESVNNQTYTNLECIIIVDGATDNSYDIAKDYCCKHSRFKLFYQNNAGSGPARNNGIDHASGEFICFIDPDDWVENDYVETLVIEQRKGDFDLVISQSINNIVNQNDIIISTKLNNKPIFQYITQDDCRENFPYIMFKEHYLDGPICKLFKRSIITEHHIIFPSYRRSQDMVFNFRYFNYIKSVCSINAHTYHIRYEYSTNNSRGRIFNNYNEIVAKIYIELNEQLKQWNIKTRYTELLHTWSFWYLYAYLCISIENNIPYKYIEKAPYNTIIHNAKPVLVSQKIVKFFLAHKLYVIANIIMRIRNKLSKLHIRNR